MAAHVQLADKLACIYIHTRAYSRAACTRGSHSWQIPLSFLVLLHKCCKAFVVHMQAAVHFLQWRMSPMSPRCHPVSVKWWTTTPNIQMGCNARAVCPSLPAVQALNAMFTNIGTLTGLTLPGRHSRQVLAWQDLMEHAIRTSCWAVVRQDALDFGVVVSF